jgi:hypothetical protein
MTYPAISAEPLGYDGGTEGDPNPFFDGRSALLSQYANSPVIGSLITAFTAIFDLQPNFAAFFDAVWNIQTAVGFGLDIWGRIVGVERALYVPNGQYLGFSEATDAFPFGSGVFYTGEATTPNYLMTDEAYRRVILAKAAMNISDCSVRAINAILRLLFPNYGTTWLRDNADMTMTFVFGARPSRIDYAIVTQSGVLPRPAGVSFNVEIP